MSLQQFVRLIEECDATSSRLDKTEALTRLDADTSSFAHTLLVQALSPYVTFGVKNFDMPSQYPDEDADRGHMFLQLMVDLEARTYTANQARSEILIVLSCYSQPTANALARVLRKDLRVGIGATEINKVFPKLIPTFSVQLAEKWLPGEKDIKYPTQLEIKHDGQRNAVHVSVEGGDLAVNHFSREGRPQNEKWGDGWEQHFEILHRAMMVLTMRHPVDWMFDGEMCLPHVQTAGSNRDTWNKTMEAKGKDGDKSKLVMYIYDTMPWDDFLRPGGSGEAKQRYRTRMLRDAYARYKMECEKHGLVPRLIVDDTEIVSNSDTETRELLKHYTGLGFEGLMAKDPDAPYLGKRSNNWLKLKNRATFDGYITGTYEGKKHSRLEGSLGGFFVEGEDENGKKFANKVGGGFSDADRALFWAGREGLIGKCAVLEATEVTKAGALKEPTFLHLHAEK